MFISKCGQTGVVAAVLGLAALGVGQVRATIIPVSPPTVTQSGGVYTYTYQVSLTFGTDATEIHSGTQTVGTTLSLSDGDYFGIFDIPGYIPGSASISLTQPLVTEGGAAWNVTNPLLGFQPDPSLGVTVGDNASLYNADFQYIGTDGGNFGPQTITDANATPILGVISFQSTNPESSRANLHYSAEDFDSSSQLEESNQGLLKGPAVVPEPATACLWLLASGALAGLMLGRRRSGLAK
jgi:hypothetical protein